MAEEVLPLSMQQKEVMVLFVVLDANAPTEKGALVLAVALYTTVQTTSNVPTLTISNASLALTHPKLACFVKPVTRLDTRPMSASIGTMKIMFQIQDLLLQQHIPIVWIQIGTPTRVPPTTLLGN
jgi:hypothetical protein